MRNILLPLFFLGLVGCSDAAKLEVDDKNSVQESTKLISQELAEDKRKKFKKAMQYFSMGGLSGLKAAMASAFSGNKTEDPEAMILKNLEKLDGLTGEEILALYDEERAAQKN